jgi:nitroreductase
VTLEKVFETDPPIFDLLARRWSPRAFEPGRPVPREALLALLQAARAAPSCFNEQPWRFLVFDGQDADALERARGCLNSGNAWARNAPVLLLSVAVDRWQRDGSPNRFAQHDVGLASENLAIEATALGLSIHFMAGFDDARARQVFGIPDGFTPMVMAAVGYRGDPETLSPKQKERELAPRTRKALGEIAFAGRWACPFGGEAADQAPEVPASRNSR